MMEKPIPDYFEKYSPGVYFQEQFSAPRKAIFSTGVPAFLGLARLQEGWFREASKPAARLMTLASHFEQHIGKPAADCYLAYAVRGFFENGGRGCYVVVLKDANDFGMEEGLEAIKHLNTIDLVCATDVTRTRSEALGLQQKVVTHCEQAGDRFAILDSRFGDEKEAVCDQWSEIDGRNGAIYYPWIKVAGFDGGTTFVPPCGHVAGVYARTDRERGVHKAPANEVLEGALGLERSLTAVDQDYLNPKRVNCIRSFPGRGIRVWGARTLSGHDEWTYVNVRRLFLTAIRWIDWNMGHVVFERNDASLWAGIERDLTSYFTSLYRSGALKGGTPREAFYVKCNEETNRPEDRELGRVVTEIGIAPANPFEFIVFRLIHGESGVVISGPAAPGQNF